MAAQKPKKDNRPSAPTTPLEQLVEIAGRLNEEGILFLLKQAHTMEYNKKVDELNETAENLSNTRWQSQAGNSKSKNAPMRTGKSGVVTIERASFGRSYILVIGNQRKTLDEHEMMSLVKMAHSETDERVRISRIFRWMQRFRDDIIIDTGVTARSPAIKELQDLLKSSFSLS